VSFPGRIVCTSIPVNSRNFLMRAAFHSRSGAFFGRTTLIEDTFRSVRRFLGQSLISNFETVFATAVEGEEVSHVPSTQAFVIVWSRKLKADQNPKQTSGPNVVLMSAIRITSRFLPSR
jgi:hypothetical protein